MNAGGDLETVLSRVVFAVCRGPPWTRSEIMGVNRATGYSELVTRFDPAAASGGTAHRRAGASPPALHSKWSEPASPW